MNETTIASLADAASTWWVQRVLNPRFQQVVPGGPEQDRHSDITEMLFAARAAQEPVADAAAVRFHEALREMFVEHLQRAAERDRIWLSYGVDYGPDHWLAEAAEKAGVSTARFPIKTRLQIGDGHVTGSVGYGVPTGLIFLAEGYEHPTCGSQQYSDGPGLVRLPFTCGKPRWHEADRIEHEFTVPEPLCATCNREEGDYYHDPSKAAYHDAHEFVEGAATVCTVCRSVRGDRASERPCARYSDAEGWVETGQPHDFQVDPATALQVA